MAETIHSAQVGLCLCIPLFGSFAIPIGGFLIEFRFAVVWHTQATRIHVSEKIFRFIIILFRCLPIPLDRFRVVLLNTLANFINLSKFSLRFGISFLSFGLDGVEI